MLYEAINKYVYTIIELLRATGLSYSDIAVGSGMSYQKVRDIVNKSANYPKIDTIRRLEAFAEEVIERGK